MHDYLKKSGIRFQHTVEGLKDNVKNVEESMKFVKIRRVLYKVSHRLHVNCSLLRREAAKNRPTVSMLYKIQLVKVQNSRKAIRTTKMKITARYTIPYLMIYKKLFIQ